MRRCDANEHFYDETKHSSCPFCATPHSSYTIGRGAASEQTVAAWDTPKAKAPVVGWLVIVEGEGSGKDFRLTPGVNTLGRAAGNAVALDFGDETISRERHCTVVFDYQNQLFFLQHGEGTNLTYLNGNVLLQPSPLRRGDIIGVGKTTLRFIPFCDHDFNWGV